MTLVTISPTYRITIPKEIREMFHVKPGQKAFFVTDGRVLTMYFEGMIQETHGSLISIDATIERQDGGSV